MDPSSLIFLVIVAIWAAYLLGHWVRRRDQLATARSIDRFSEAMRVLERRTPTRPVTAARATARSYVVAPVRVAPGATGPRTAAAVSAPAPGASAVRGAPTRRGPRAGELTAEALSTGTPGPVDRHGTRRAITRDAARRRAGLVLGLLIGTVIAWTLVPTTALGWWVAALVTALLAGVLVQLRRTARGRGAAARSRASDRIGVWRRSAVSSTMRSRRRAAGRRPVGRRSPVARRGPASRVPAPARRRHHQDARSVLDQLGRARRRQEDALQSVLSASEVTGTTLIPDADTDLSSIASAQRSPTGTSDEATVDGWQPVPVPPPTYTLKAKARPAARRPGAPGVSAAPPVEAEVGSSGREQADVCPEPVANTPASAPAPGFDLDEILERRIAAGG